jgi:hypothetical protein
MLIIDGVILTGGARLRKLIELEHEDTIEGESSIDAMEFTSALKPREVVEAEQEAA